LQVCSSLPPHRPPPPLINFDDPSFEGATGDFVVPNGYGGLNWDNVHIYDPTNNHDLSPSGYDFSVVSSPNVAFNAGGSPITISSDTIFSLNSVWLHSVWDNHLEVEVKGFLGEVPVPGADKIVFLDASGDLAPAPTLVTFDSHFLGVDSVAFIPSKGTPFYTKYYGPYFAMDNLNVDVLPLLEVPEPGTWVTAALLLAAIAFSQRDRLSRARRIGR
jgi:hypothetical protein